MNFLHRLTILQLTILGISILALSLATLLFKDVSRNLETSTQADEDTKLIQLLDAIEKIAHNHAVERGLTAGFLGNPTAEAKQKVDAQRVKADQAVDNFDALLEQDWPAELRLNDKIRSVQNQLRGKSAVRTQVDNRDGSQAFGYYSRLNAMALNSANALMLHIHGIAVTSTTICPIERTYGAIKRKGQWRTSAPNDQRKTQRRACPLPWRYPIHKREAKLQFVG